MGGRTKKPGGVKRQSSKKARKHPSQKPGTPLTAFARIAGLKGRIEDLERRVKALEDTHRLEFGKAEPAAMKRGPRFHIADAELFGYRDGLINLLEPIWPQLSGPLLAASDAGAVRALLEPLCTPQYVSQRPYQKRLLENAEALFEFLRSPKFRRKPSKRAVMTAFSRTWDEESEKAANRFPTRQIANAMAGVPDVEWRTSLDRCSASPSPLGLPLDLEDHYRNLYGLPARPEGTGTAPG